MTGGELVKTLGFKASWGTDEYPEASRVRAELQGLGYTVRIVTRLAAGNRQLGRYRLTWWPTPKREGWARR